MTRREYTTAVLAGLRHVTESEKEQIRAELDAHMEDHMLALMEHGYEQKEAEQRAANNMGDPLEVSRELQKCYSYGWLIAWRILFVAWLLFNAIAGPGLVDAGRAVHQNLEARFDPLDHMAESVRERVKQELDVEIECGNSIVKFYAVGETVRGEPEVFYCIRSKQLLGYAADNIGIQYYAPDDMENELRAGGGYFSNSRIRYGNDHMELPEGTESIIVVVSWWDEEQSFEIPIDWEVAA